MPVEKKAGDNVIGGTIKGELLKDDVEKVLVDGFFPRVERDAVAQRRRAAGLREAGLPYAHDPGITRHLAEFTVVVGQCDTHRGPSSCLSRGRARR